MFSSKEVKPVVSTTEPTVNSSEEKPISGDLKLSEMESDERFNVGPMMEWTGCNTSLYNTNIEIDNSINLDRDCVAQALKHPYIHKMLATKGLEDYHIRAIYDVFFCEINRDRTDIGFQYVSTRSKTSWIDRSVEEDIKYHVNAMVESKPIQLRIELINQTISDYQRCKGIQAELD